jgi:YjjG family noncanonical pyrimidine nucleotidase
MPTYHWVLFDADNTVFDFDKAEHDSLRLAMADYGLTFQEDHYALYQRINKECWTAFESGRLPKSRLRTERFERFFKTLEVRMPAAEFGDAYLAHLGQTGHLLAGAQSLVEALGVHYQLGLITNGLKEVQRPRLANTPLAEAFEVVVVSDEIGVAKPDSAFFDYAFQRMGQPDPREVLVVGDNLNADIRGALEYGAHACWYNPHGRDRYLAVEPTLEIRDLEELRAHLL